MWETYSQQQSSQRLTKPNSSTRTIEKSFLKAENGKKLEGEQWSDMKKLGKDAFN